ncbi:hypothetical protein MKW94_017559 [Papaver nudicaule]|uniref:Uncharacterized protein n=1 Tax=Papaver nudicaule TaxID=74823 RepID=A0AA41SJ17_PAPNU|nr:hypothetical protein [Papaver nudicaule]
MVRSRGGHSSLGYVFVGPENPKPFAAPNYYSTNKSSHPSPPLYNTKKTPARIVQMAQANNYYCVDGQNTGNFITVNDQLSTKVHVAAGGGSSLGFLFDGSGSNN